MASAVRLVRSCVQKLQAVRVTGLVSFPRDVTSYTASSYSMRSDHDREEGWSQYPTVSVCNPFGVGENSCAKTYQKCLRATEGRLTLFRGSFRPFNTRRLDVLERGHGGGGALRDGHDDLLRRAGDVAGCEDAGGRAQEGDFPYVPAAASDFSLFPMLLLRNTRTGPLMLRGC